MSICTPNGIGLAAVEAKEAARKAAEEAVRRALSNLPGLQDAIRQAIEDIVPEAVEEAVEEALQDALDDLLRRGLPVLIEYPTNKTYTLCLSMPVTVTVTQILHQISGAGTVSFSHNPNDTIPQGSTLTMTVSGADDTSEDLAVMFLFEQVA